MIIYLVSTGAHRHHAFMRRHGLRMLHLAYAWRNPVKDIPYAIDNGAYSFWVNHKPFDEKKFLSSLDKAGASGIAPDFVVCPDIVAGGMESLEYSMSWRLRLPRPDYYLAVQDGMPTQAVIDKLCYFEGIFVGGTTDWKLRTSEEWVTIAHTHDKKCHIGRIGTLRRMLWAKRIGADSVDTSTIPQGPPDMRRFKRVIAMNNQECLKLS